MTDAGWMPIPPEPLSEKEGWRKWVTHDGSKPPPLPTVAQWESISESERRQFNVKRKMHHSSCGPVMTEAMQGVLHSIVDRALNNLSSIPGARPGAVIDGEPNVGKTMTVAHAGRIYERELREQFGLDMEDRGEAEWLPVVYYSLDAPATVKILNEGIANFYGALVPSQPKTAQLTDIVVEHAQKCATTLFIIDDIHYLDMNRESAREVNDHLKMLMNETSATFIYAGVECSHTKLLTEGQPETKKHLGQTRRRFARMPLEPFKLKTPEQRQEWQRLLNSLEKLFVLRSMERGVLGAPEMAQYLHDRTDGFIGSLVWLLRYAAGEAINTGEEKFTRKLLDKVKIDDAAEKDYEAKQVRRSDSG